MATGGRGRVTPTRSAQHIAWAPRFLAAADKNGIIVPISRLARTRGSLGIAGTQRRN